jgi:hypothetical protein
MSAEPSALAAVVARLAHPEINLAAYGSVSFAMVSIILSPVLTLLSLSTSLSRDWQSYQVGRRLMNLMGIGTTLVHILVAYTPLYDLLVKYVIGAPPEIIEPARISLMVGVPWAYAVAMRRFHQGVLIRFNHASTITRGTFWRFVADALVLIVGYLTAALPGAILATCMMLVGVWVDAIYVNRRVQPVLKYQVRTSPPVEPPVQMKQMALLYLPLAITPLLQTLVRPIGSAALSRLPDPITALAVWPVINAFSGLLVTPGTAFNEVVNAFVDQPDAKRTLTRFMWFLILGETAVMVLIAATSVSYAWFAQVSGLEPSSAQVASRVFWLLIPIGVLVPLNAWFSGVILHSRKTRSITESMVIYLFVFALGLVAGMTLVHIEGLTIVTGASLSASISQTAWLWFRSRAARRRLQ